MERDALYHYTSELCSRRVESDTLQLGELSVSLRTGRVFLEGGVVSIRSVACEAQRNGKPVFLTGGLVLRRRTAAMTAADVYSAGDEIGARECDVIGSLLDSFPLERLFAGRSMLVVTPWEGSVEAASAVIRHLAARFRVRTIAVDTLPPEYDGPPHRTAAHRLQLEYCRALERTLPGVQRLIELLSGAGDVFPFSTVSRTGDEQLLDLVVRCGLVAA